MAQLVFRSENSASLWSLKAIHAMCEMEQSKVGHSAHLRSSAPNCHLCLHSPTCVKSVLTDLQLKVLLKLYLAAALGGLCCVCYRFAPRLRFRTCASST